VRRPNGRRPYREAKPSGLTPEQREGASTSRPQAGESL